MLIATSIFNVFGAIANVVEHVVETVVFLLTPWDRRSRLDTMTAAEIEALRQSGDLTVGEMERIARFQERQAFVKMFGEDD